MKKKNLLILLFLFVVSFQVGAQPAEDSLDHCGVYDSCVTTRGIMFINRQKTHLAKGYGNSCSEAEANAHIKFINRFGEMNDCGFSVDIPTTKGLCTQQENGTYTQWIECAPPFKPYKSKRRARCVNIGGVLSC